MKIDKRNPTHWLCLALFGLNTLVAMALRPLLHRRRMPRQIILYGHKLSGNLLALHRHVSANAGDEFRLTFLTMDKRYARQLHADGMRAAIATRPEAIMLLARADALVSDHGLHVMSWLPGHCSIRFFDVWHGIPFKGFDADDFRIQHRYDETWVASPLMQSLYVGRYGFAPERVIVTGYARTDILVNHTANVPTTRQTLRLDPQTKVALFAPTWQQDVPGRSIWPFGESAETFLVALSRLAVQNGSTIVIRSHLNSGVVTHAEHPGVRWIPFDVYPDTESLLLASDVLVCDWSSIAFDWLLLDRPTIFLDVPAPFAKGLSLSKDYRYGELVAGLDALINAMTQALSDTQSYWQRHGGRQQAIRQRVYNGFADGSAAARYIARLREGLALPPPGERR